MSTRILNITIILIVYVGCVPQRNILNPIENVELRSNSDKLIYTDIDQEYYSNLIFNGAYQGFQCSEEIEDLDAFINEGNFDEYHAFKCICYNYKVKTEQGIDLYIASENKSYLNTRVCYDSNKSIVEHPRIENLKLALINSKTKHINLSEVKIITENEINQKSKFGRSPILVYHINQNRLLWRVKRQFGKLNVTVFEFDIDAITGEILRIEKLPYRRTFWQWLNGTEM